MDQNITSLIVANVTTIHPLYAAPSPGSDLVLWLTYIKELFIFLGLVAAAFLAYAKIIIPDMFPLVQLNVQCNTLGSQYDRAILEVLIIMRNVGGSAIKVENLSLRLDYLLINDEPEHIVVGDPRKAYLNGRVYFPHCLTDEFNKIGENKISDKRLELLHYRNFVRPLTEQIFTYVTSVPRSTSVVQIMASFETSTDITLLKRISLNLSRRLGLINYSPIALSSPHVCERAFKVDSTIQPENAV